MAPDRIARSPPLEKAHDIRACDLVAVAGGWIRRERRRAVVGRGVVIAGKHIRVGDDSDRGSPDAREHEVRGKPAGLLALGIDREALERQWIIERYLRLLGQARDQPLLAPALLDYQPAGQGSARQELQMRELVP